MFKYASVFMLSLALLLPSVSAQSETAVKSVTSMVNNSATAATVPALPAKPVTAAAVQFVAGKHYDVIPVPVVTRDKTKVEVVELFWYGCNHCFKFEPLIGAWKSTLGADVDFVGMPAMWSPTMTMHARAFYTAKALGVESKTHKAFFEALNLKKQQLNDMASLTKFFVGFGVDKDKFEKTYNSFGVDSQVNLAESRAKSYGMQGTPEIIVNGKFRISTEKAGDQAKMLEVASYLIAKERLLLVKK